MARYKSLFCTGLIVLALGGCESEGPAERAGKQLDKTVDELTKPMGPAEQAGEKIDKAVNDADQALEEARNKARKAVE